MGLDTIRSLNTTKLNVRDLTLLDGLVLHLQFDEDSGDALDVSGNGNHGEVFGATRVLGKKHRALSFDGVDDYVRVPHATSLVPVDAWTIVGWFYYTGIKEIGSIISKSASMEGYTYFVYISSTDKLCSIVYSFSFDHVESVQTLVKGQWYHFAVVWQYPGEEKMYINGVFDNSATAKKDAINTGGDVTIAELRPKRYCLLRGIIDEVRIYNKPLSATEIKLLYETSR